MALIQYRKPARLNRPLADDDPYLQPPPIIQQDIDPGFTANGETEAALRQGAADIEQWKAEQGIQQQPTPPIDDWDLGAQGVDPAIVLSARSATLGGPSAPNILTTATRRNRQPMDETLPNGNPALDPLGKYNLSPTREESKQSGVILPPSPDTQPVDAAGSVGESTGGPGAVRSLVDKQNRPIANKSIQDPIERYLEYQQRLNEWEPPKAHGWRRYLPALLSGAGMVAGAFGRNQDAVDQNAFSLARSFDPAFQAKAWKANQQKDIQDQIERHIERQQKITGIAHTKAATGKLNAPPEAKPKRIVKDKDGVFRPIDPVTGLGEDGKPVQGEVARSATGGYKGWVHDPDGVAHYYEDGKDTGRTDPGRNKVKLTDGRLVDPSQSYSAELGAGKESEAVGRQNEAARQFNAQIEANIAAVKGERTKVEDALKSTAPTVTKTRANPVTGREETYQERNPIYADLENRRDKLIDDQRRMNADKKPVVSLPKVAPVLKPPGGYNIEGAISAWKMKPENHGKEPTKEQIADWQKKVNAKNKQ